LRLEPEMTFARQGIVEALKARNIVYRAMLKYFLWMGKLDSRVRWGIVFGGLLITSLLNQAASAAPVLKPLIFPFLIAYAAFAVLTWISMPLFNLLLRFNRFGRLALSREQIVASNFLAANLALALVLVVAGLALRSLLLLFSAAFFGFQCARGWPRWSMGGYTLALGLLWWIGIALSIVGLDREGSTLVLAFRGILVGCIAANVLASVLPRR
jgi:hypothetical protein